ncbi:MAG: Ig-like domain-containing protein [Lachnospiraceae bacterium]|nr:Ig-like domain-containing protein [Lachnospiraceae bacterium]
MNAKKLKRGMALFLLVVMLATSSMEVPTFAESVHDQMVSENKTIQGNQEVEKPQEDTTSENEVVSDGEQDSENKIVSENVSVSKNQTVSEDTLSQEEALSGDVNSLEIPIGGITAQPYSYGAQITVSINSTEYEAKNFYILYSDSEGNLPTEEAIEKIGNIGYKILNKNKEEHVVGKEERIIHFNLNPIMPISTIYYQLFYWDGSIYHKITQPATFTTNYPITQSRISFTDVTVKTGYTDAYIEFQVLNPEDEFIIDDNVYVSDGTDEYPASEKCDESGDPIPGMYNVTISLGKDESKELKPEVKVYTGFLKKILVTGTSIMIAAKKDQSYSVSDFDEQIFNNIKSQLAIPSDTIKQSELEEIYQLKITSQDDSISTPVQSLKGVEHLTNLTDLEITGQDVTSASEIEHLSSLKHVNLIGNKITKMPDLSELVQIEETDETDESNLQFDYNFMLSDSITEAKLPASMSGKTSWITQTQSNQLGSKTQCITADTYYAVGDKHPFLFEANNFPAKRDYTLTVSVNGVKKTAQIDDHNGHDCYLISDLEIETGTYPVVMSLTDCYENQWTDTRNITFVGDEGLIKDTYLDASEKEVSIQGYIPGNSDVAEILLKNAEGTVVGKNGFKYRSYKSEDEILDYRYQGIFSNINNFDQISWNSIKVNATVSFFKLLAAGDYNLVIKTEDAKEYLIAKTVHISEKTVISNMRTNNNISGEYYYLTLEGANIDPQKVWPVIQTQDGKVISEKGSVKHLYNNEYQYQLKKLEMDTYWKEKSTFNVAIGSESGSEFVDARKNKTFTYRDDSRQFLSDYYNYRRDTNKYKVVFGSKVKDETKVTIKLYSGLDYGSEQLAVAEGTVTNGCANLNLKDLQGNDFVPENNINYYKKIIYTENYKGTENVWDEIDWYGIDELPSYILHSDDAIRTTDSERIDFAITLPKQTDRTQNFEAYLGQVSESKEGNVAVKLTAEETTYNGKKCVKLIGTRTGSMLSSGYYSLNIFCNNTLIAEPNIAVYNNDLFYIERSKAYGSSSGEFNVCITSNQLKGEYKKVYNSNVSDADALKLVNDFYTLEVYDLLGNKLSGCSVKSASYSSGDIRITLTGIPTDYLGCYIKVLSKKKTDKDGYILDGTDSTIYYEYMPYFEGIDVKSEYGYYATYATASLSFQTSSVPHDERISWISYDSIDIGERSGMLPVTINFYLKGEKTPVKTLKIEKSGKHQFTSSQLPEISQTEVYTITAESADRKQCANGDGYVGVITSTPDVPETDITLSLDKTSISMEEGETVKLSATPSATTEQTISWSSSNQKVAAVENGTVTAIGAGTAMITASLSGGASATCQIVVMGKTDSDAIDLADTTIKAVKKQVYTGKMVTPKLIVMNGKVPLIENADYILSYRNNWNAGTDTAVAVVYGIGAYKGTKEINFTITPKAIKGASIKAYDVVATSAAQSPSVIVMDNGKQLAEGVDYNITGLKNNQKPGTGKFTIEGINNYTGKKSGSFKIYPANTKILTGWSISANIPSEGYTYDGTKKTPVMAVKDAAGTVLQFNKDYTVSYKNNVNAGTAIAIVKGKGTNKGTKDCYFKIKPLNISTAKIAEIAAVNYSGGAVNPKVVVKSKAGKKLRLNKDYTLTYSNNYKASTITNAKTAAVFITGTGNYSGTVIKDFQINKIVLGKGFSVKELKTQTYPGNALAPTFKLYYKKRLLKQNQDYTVTYNKNIKVGKWEIVITAAENSSFTGSITKTFKIKK